MIATHSIKALDARLKQAGIMSEINAPVSCFGSHLIPIEYFAAPRNSADIRAARQLAIDTSTGDTKPAHQVPDIQDGRVKQVLIPADGAYIAVTPAPSLAIMNLVNDAKLSNKRHHMLQPIPSGATNHGDPVAKNNGWVRLIDNAPAGDMYAGRFHGDHVLFTARVEGMNTSSSYVSTGLPALTGIGGAVHVIERKTGLNLEFGFGIKNITAEQRAKRGQNASTEAPLVSRTKINLITDEVTATADIAILFMCDNEQDAAKIIAACKELHRLCGGIIIDSRARFKPQSDLPAYFWYAAFDAMEVNGIDDYWHGIEKLGGKLVQVGYSLLEKPKLKKMGRNYPHAWAEPIFKLIKLNSPPDFFKLSEIGTSYFWDLA